MRAAGSVTEGATVAVVEHGSGGARGRSRPRQPLRTKLLVNLSEPSQLERVSDLDVDGVGLLRAELMVVEALDGEHPRALLERGEGERFVRAHGRLADAVRGRLLAPPDHLPDDRLPQQRVPRPARAASASSPRRPTR